MKENIVVAADIEYTLASRDFAFEVLARVLGEVGKKLYAVLSSYDDVMGFSPDDIENEQLRGLAQEWVPGTTPLLILPFVTAYCGDFNPNMVEDLAEITDLRVNHGVPSLIRDLKETGAHVVLISSSISLFAMRTSRVLNLPYCYASVPGDFSYLNKRSRRELREFATKVANYEMVEFDGTSLVRTQENLARVRTGEQVLMKLWQKCHLPSLARPALGGKRKVHALRHAVQYATGQFTSDMSKDWLSNVVFLGDSITDEVVLREVAKGDGLAVSVNGNAFALAHSDVAVVSEDLATIASLVEVFSRTNKATLLGQIAGASEKWAKSGVFLNDHRPALSTLSSNMRTKLKGEKAMVN